MINKKRNENQNNPKISAHTHKIEKEMRIVNVGGAVER